MTTNLRYRRVRNVWMLVAVVLPGVLLIGCGASRSVASVSGHARSSVTIPNLTACVQRWNQAPLGRGRFLAAIDAVTGKAALMVAFQNGACGLAFPPPTKNADNEERGTYVNGAQGNYVIARSPLGFVKHSEITKLRADARRYTNVIVEDDTGRVIARRHQRRPMVTVPASVFIRPVWGCKYSMDILITMGRLRIRRKGVGCTEAQAVIWAWTGESIGPEERVRHIIGWTCVGSHEFPDFTPVTYEVVTCTKGSDVVEATDERAA